jgi:hypothetical protein
MPCKPLRTHATAATRRGMVYFRPDAWCVGWSFAISGSADGAPLS